MIPRRPSLPDVLRVPTSVTPSMLGAWNKCRLRLVATSPINRDVVAQSPRGPDAEFGTIVHRAIAAARRGEQHPDQWFLRSLRERQAELAIDPATQRYSDLAECVRPGKVDEAIAMIVSNYRPGRSNTSSSSASGVATERRTGSEVPLVSESLGLRGSADLISEVDGGVEIVDFKTGSVLDANGEVRRSYRLQLLAYALMVREREPKVRISLVLDNGTRTLVACDDGALSEARVEIDRMVSALPDGDDVAPTNLAEPGPDCISCSLRSSCPDYLAAAPTWWRNVPREIERAPYDSWGEVRTASFDGVRRVTLVDAAGRGVRIDRLSSFHDLSDVREGDKLWFFGLNPETVKRGFGGERPHPRLFHDRPRDGFGREAWTLQILR